MSSLRVYIAAHCPISVYSVQLASEAAAAFPNIEVRVIDVDQPGWKGAGTPDDVLFTPGYFLNGRPICWGNPYREELFRGSRKQRKAPGCKKYSERGM